MVRPEVKKKRWAAAAAAVQSKKKQKLLQKVVLRKKSKVDRSKILAELKSCQLKPEELKHFHSTSSMQTSGLKKFIKTSNIKVERSELDDPDLDAAKLIRRKRCKLAASQQQSQQQSSSEDTDAMSSESESSEQDYAEQNQADVGEQKFESPKELEREAQPIDSSAIDKHKTDEVNNVAVTKREPIVQTKFVQISRPDDIQEARLKLPIINEEHTIIDTIRNNDVTVISGETGSGKTTQVPQFLYENGFDKVIAITEPRRIAAMSMSERVAKELCLSLEEVSYQIRFAGTVSDKTKIKFITDGVLLRECQQDFLLKKYSVIIIDEAHERSIFSDILIGFLSRIVRLRAKSRDPLKLVIMSASLRVNDFTENKLLFKIPPPVINIEARQFPVTIHFAKKTPDNYLKAAHRMARAIDSKMPKGGILIFVTSQMDVKVLCKKLKSDTMHCLGLYAMLPMEKQRLVFQTPPEGKRFCVIATNVAETSITIPNIKYVIDTGKEKTKLYDEVTGISKFVICWTSKASALQRTGRAGRVGPGHCYRLYSSAVFSNDFEDHSKPRILQKPVEDIILQMKSMNIDNVVNFPFPTRPSLEALMSAEKKLITLGALDDSKIKTARYADLCKTEFSSRLTPLGEAMSKFAVSARCSKMIVLSPADLIHHVIALVSALTVREMFLESNKWSQTRKAWAGHGNSKLLGDFKLMIRAICEADTFQCNNKSCINTGLRTKAMLEIHKLRNQLLHEASSYVKGIDSEGACKTPSLFKPTEAQCKVLRQLILSSHLDKVAKKLPDGYIVQQDPNDPSKKIKKKLRHAYECMETSEFVYINSQSVLRGEEPEFIVYRELYENGKKKYMRDIAVIDSTWLPYYADKLCHFAESQDKWQGPPRYDKELDMIICTTTATYGTLNWQLGIVDVPMHLLDTGIEIYKHFASFLLSGDVIPWFKKNSAKLLSPPSIMTKAWSKLQPRTSKLLKALLDHNVKSKADLQKAWRDDKDCKYTRAFSFELYPNYLNVLVSLTITS